MRLLKTKANEKLFNKIIQYVKKMSTLKSKFFLKKFNFFQVEIHIKIYNLINNKILKNIYLIKKFRLSILQFNQKILKIKFINITI